MPGARSKPSDKQYVGYNEVLISPSGWKVRDKRGCYYNPQNVFKVFKHFKAE